LSPRRNRPRRAGPKSGEEPAPLRVPNLVTGAPPGWQVRVIQPARAEKPYVCPGCQRTVQPGTKHVVAWREGEEDLRRHWHSPCWDREARSL